MHLPHCSPDIHRQKYLSSLIKSNVLSPSRTLLHKDGFILTKFVNISKPDPSHQSLKTFLITNDKKVVTVGQDILPSQLPYQDDLLKSLQKNSKHVKRNGTLKWDHRTRVESYFNNQGCQPSSDDRPEVLLPVIDCIGLGNKKETSDGESFEKQKSQFPIQKVRINQKDIEPRLSIDRSLAQVKQSSNLQLAHIHSQDTIHQDSNISVRHLKKRNDYTPNKLQHILSIAQSEQKFRVNLDSGISSPSPWLNKTNSQVNKAFQMPDKVNKMLENLKKGQPNHSPEITRILNQTTLRETPRDKQKNTVQRLNLSIDLGKLKRYDKELDSQRESIVSQNNSQPRAMAGGRKGGDVSSTYQSTHRNFMDKYGNIQIKPEHPTRPVSRSVMATCFVRKSQMSKKEAEKDIIKFFGKYCCGDDFFQQLPIMKQADPLIKTGNQSIITQSNHYRYNRMREGGWGMQAPKNNDSTQDGDSMTQQVREKLNSANKSIDLIDFLTTTSGEGLIEILNTNASQSGEASRIRRNSIVQSNQKKDMKDYNSSQQTNHRPNKNDFSNLVVEASALGKSVFDVAHSRNQQNLANSQQFQSNPVNTLSSASKRQSIMSSERVGTVQGRVQVNLGNQQIGTNMLRYQTANLGYRGMKREPKIHQHTQYQGLGNSTQEQQISISYKPDLVIQCTFETKNTVESQYPLDLRQCVMNVVESQTPQNNEGKSTKGGDVGNTSVSSERIKVGEQFQILKPKLDQIIAFEVLNPLDQKWKVKTLPQASRQKDSVQESDLEYSRAASSQEKDLQNQDLSIDVIKTYRALNQLKEAQFKSNAYKKNKMEKIEALKKIEEIKERKEEQQRSIKKRKKEREEMETLIRVVQEQIKQKRRLIQIQSKRNEQQMEQLIHQAEVFKKLDPMIQTCLKQESLTQIHSIHSLNDYDSLQNSQDPLSSANDQTFSPKFKSPSQFQAESEIDTESGQGLMKEVIGMYKQLFEKDLYEKKNRVEDQIYSLKDITSEQRMEANQLKIKNSELQKSIKLYQELLKKTLRDKKEDESDDGAVLKVKEKDDMSLWQSNKSPRFTGSRGATQYVLPLCMFLDLRKLEQVNYNLRLTWLQTQPVDSIIQILTLIKSVMGSHKLTLFVIEPDYVKKVFMGQKDRKKNTRKVSFGNSFIWAIYLDSAEYIPPTFKDIENLKQKITQTEVTLLINDPSMNNKVFMVLQITTLPKKISKKNKSFSPPKRRQERGQSERGSCDGSGRTPPSSMNGKTSGISLSTLNARQNGPSIGWNQNDILMLRIICQFVVVTSQTYLLKEVKEERARKVKDIIEFAKKTTCLNTYPQIIELFKEEIPKMLEFESCTIFFSSEQSGNLFTMARKETNKNKDLPKDGDLEIFKEVAFSEDNIIQFPYSLGISGQAFSKFGLKYQNDFGKLVRLDPQQNSNHNINFPDNSSNKSSPVNRSQKKTTIPIFKDELLKLNLQKLPHSRAYTKQQTSLEKIEEDRPDLENEVQISSPLIGLRIQRKQDSVDKVQKPFLSRATSEKSNLVEDESIDLQMELGNNNKHLRSHNIVKTKDNNSMPKLQRNGQDSSESSKNQKLEVLQTQVAEGTKFDKKNLMKQPSIQGTIFDLVNKRNLRGLKQQNQVRAFCLKTGEFSREATVIECEFNPDIDNFEGVNKITNFVISPTFDNSYGFGDASVGVIQLFNKKGGSQRVEKDDLNRLRHICRFFGGLGGKASAITNLMSLMVGMQGEMAKRRVDMKDVDRWSDDRIFQQLILPIDTMDKLLSPD